MVTNVPRPRGAVTSQLNSTLSRRAVHTVALQIDTTLQIVTARSDILPFVDNSIVGRYRFATTPFLNDQTSSTGIALIRDHLTPVFSVSIEPVSNGYFIDIWVTDVAGAPVNLVNGQGFNLSLLIRDS